MRLVVLALVLSTYKAAETSECNKRFFAEKKFVCVCSLSYCDSLDPISKVPPGQAVLYESNENGARFTKTSLSFSSKSLNQTVAHINRTQKYQFIVGFGGAFTDAAGINIASLNEGLQKQLINGYFSRNGLEYTIGRVPMASCDFCTREYSYDDVDGDFDLDKFQLAEEDLKYKIPFIKMAINASSHEVLLFGSPWSAPAWMKTNGKMHGRGVLKGNPGEKYYKTWANYFVKFLQSYESHDITFWGLTAQNEPLDGFIPDFAFQAMGFTPETQRDFIKLDLGPALKEAGYGANSIKLMILDDQRFELPKWAEVVLSDPEAAQYVSGVAFHWYMNGIAPPVLLDKTHSSFPGVFLLSTEACAGFLPWDLVKVDFGSWERAEMYAHDIIEDLLHWTVGWVDWNLALNIQGGPNWVNNFVDSPVIVNRTSQEFYRQPMYYAIAQFSKLLPPGSIRVDVKLEDSFKEVMNLDIAAFETPIDSTVVIIVNRQDVSVQLGLHDAAVGYLNMNVSPHSIQSYVWWTKP